MSEFVAVEFQAGPLDGVTHGWRVTDDHLLRLPEDLYCAWGSYHLRLEGESHGPGGTRVTSRFVYGWCEGGEPT